MRKNIPQFTLPVRTMLTKDMLVQKIWDFCVYVYFMASYNDMNWRSEL